MKFSWSAKKLLEHFSTSRSPRKNSKHRSRREKTVDLNLLRKSIKPYESKLDIRKYLRSSKRRCRSLTSTKKNSPSSKKNFPISPFIKKFSFSNRKKNDENDFGERITTVKKKPPLPKFSNLKRGAKKIISMLDLNNESLSKKRKPSLPKLDFAFLAKLAREDQKKKEEELRRKMEIEAKLKGEEYEYTKFKRKEKINFRLIAQIAKADAKLRGVAKKRIKEKREKEALNRLMSLRSKSANQMRRVVKKINKQKKEKEKVEKQKKEKAAKIEIKEIEIKEEIQKIEIKEEIKVEIKEEKIELEEVKKEEVKKVEEFSLGRVDYPSLKLKEISTQVIKDRIFPVPSDNVDSLKGFGHVKKVHKKMKFQACEDLNKFLVLDQGMYEGEGKEENYDKIVGAALQWILMKNFHLIGRTRKESNTFNLGGSKN